MSAVSEDGDQLTHIWETGTSNKATVLYSCLQVYATFCSRDLFDRAPQTPTCSTLLPLLFGYLPNKMYYGDLCCQDDVMKDLEMRQCAFV